MAHDEYEHQRRQTAALERIAELLEALVRPALSFTEQEADRNARAGRPCCHATGPNHHPACTTNRTEQQQ